MTQEYEMIEFTDLIEFNKEVTEMLNNGWKLKNDGTYDFTPDDHNDWTSVYWASFIKENKK